MMGTFVVLELHFGILFYIGLNNICPLTITHNKPVIGL